jgi:cytochrome P450
MASLFILQAAGVLLSVFVYFGFIRKKGSGLPLPPGPKPLPVIGNLRNLPPAGKLEYTHWLSFKERYGPLSSITVLGQPMIIVHDRKALLDLLEKHSVKTSNRPSQVFANELCGLGRMIPSLQYSDYFRFQRKIIHQQIGTKALASRFGEVQDIESRRLLLRILRNPEDMREHIKTEAAAIILKITYGYNLDPHQADPLVALVEYMMECLVQAFVPLSWLVDVIPPIRHLPKGFPGTAQFRKVSDRCKAVTDAMIEESFAFVQRQIANKTERPSLVSSMIHQYSDGKGDLKASDLEAISSCAAIMYGAGADTTVSTISSMILAMVLHPDIQKKAQAEIDSVVGVGVMPDLKDRERLPYTSALTKECFRWIPVVPIGTTHVASEDLTCGGYSIPKGSYILPQIWWFCHDPAVHPEPERFLPERFIAPRNEPDPAQHVFGYGRRICPGRYLAEDSVFLSVARLLACFDMAKQKDNLGREIDFEIDMTPGLICRPGTFPYSISPRSEKHAELIQSVELDYPWEQGDAPLLNSRVRDVIEER